MSTERRNLRTGLPFWLASAAPHVRRQRLGGDLSTEVLVIGAGVTGAIMAEALSRRHDVVVVDRRGVARGSTAASTALGSYEIDTPMLLLRGMIGREATDRAWRRAHRAAIDLVEQIRTLSIDCGLAFRNGLTLAGTVLDAKGLQAEVEIRRAADLNVQFLDPADVAERYGIDRAALLSDDAFVVDPRRLATGYLQRAIDRGARLFAPVETLEVDRSQMHLRVATAAGGTIEAEHIVYCTGYELPSFVRPRGHRRVSTYAIATYPQTGTPLPIIADTIVSEASDPYLYFRGTSDGRIICGGEDEPIADAAARDALLPEKSAAIAAKLAGMLPDLKPQIEFAWAGTFGESDSGLPSIGRSGSTPRCWTVLGFGGNGMINARIAADVVAGALDGVPDPDADLYDTV